MSIALNNALTMDRSLDDMAYDYLGQMLLQKETEELLRELEKEQADGLTGEMDAFFAQQEKRHQKEMSRYFCRRNTKRLFTKTLPGLGRVAAIVLAVMIAVGGVAMAVSETFRVRVLELVSNLQLGILKYEFRENREASFDVPVEWIGSHYPAWIPEGYEITNLISYPGYSNVTFTDPEIAEETGASYADFNISEQDCTVIEFDMQRAEISKTLIQGFEADLIQISDSVYLLWTDGEAFFQIGTRNMSMEDTLRFANSTYPVWKSDKK
ncbi:MAG: DUF4367 domain-containing protein [Clostridia bacterium]|nr:DUF4367 domain-containing protein [Clostridia bacterium]